jgi:acyl-CoA reductase-like NAD-dependent aldehyde dehydrogenase
MDQLGASFIDNAWHKGSGETFVSVNPTTRQALGDVRFGTAADVDRAVRAAAAAFPGWSALPRSERANHLRTLHKLLTERSEHFVQTMALEIGSPVWFGRMVQMGLPLKNLEVTIGALETHFKDEAIGPSLVVREPIGVVAAVTPWNAPLHQIVAKVGAALAAGCTMVLKPSEVAARTAMLFAETVKDAGLPPGVFNMVFGDAQVGEALVKHPLVNMVSFTGSSAVGRAVAAAAAQGIKKVTLELGGKSAAILLDESMMEAAAGAILRLCFSNSGQICVANSRFLVPRALKTKVEELCAANAKGWIMGDPQAEATKLGPVATATQHQRVASYIRRGTEEKGRLVSGADPVPDDLQGYFVPGTIFSDVTADMTIAREEIFGPVLCIMPYDSVDEAITIANNTPYGLSGSVWTNDKSVGLAVARRMRTGQVALNGAPQNLGTPFGGYGESGYGRENGPYGIDEFLNYKAIHGAA